MLTRTGSFVTKTPKKRGNTTIANETPATRLMNLVDEVTAAAKTAKRHNKSLNGDNYYATKVADLRAEATNA
jgi:hypothetical protein